jgi:DNA-binding helix-hairpin-helix protein with protein kinase domain
VVPVGCYPQAGEVLRVSGAPITLTLQVQVGRSWQNPIFRALTSNGHEVAVVWHDAGESQETERRATAALVALGCPHPALAWPVGIAEGKDGPSWGTLMRLIPRQFQPLGMLLARAEQPSLRALARIGAELAAACAALRESGLTYRDLDLATPLADPATGEVIIPVINSAGTLGQSPHQGPLPFQAPELVRGDALPSAMTDLHTLAVVLFYLLVHGHPLQGKRTEDQPGVEGFRALGPEALFVFDPDDESNAPPPGDPMTIWWPIYPAFIRALFTQAFTAGLADPRLGSRVPERQWHQAMIALADAVLSCSCGASVIRDADDPGKPCWRCRAAPPESPSIRRTQAHPDGTGTTITPAA